MVSERVLGNIHRNETQFHSPPRLLDELELHWWELDRRAMRKTTRDGRQIRVLMPIGKSLGDGDILYDDGAVMIVARVMPCEVLVARPRTLAEMALLALEIGNLHAPAQVAGAELLIAPDGPVEAALNDLGLPFQRQMRCFRPRRCIGMPSLQFSTSVSSDKIDGGGKAWHSAS